MSQWPPPQSPGSAPSSGTPVAQCTVTGTWHPTDDLVNFQGQLVCAEGKQILLDRIMAGESPTLMAGRPSVLRRFGCIFMDYLLVVLPIVIFQIIMELEFFKPHANLTLQEKFRHNAIFPGIFGPIIFIIMLCYFAILHSRYGKSVGKMAGHLRVINLNGSPISRRTAWIRSLAFVWTHLANGMIILISIFVLPHRIAAICIAMTGLLTLSWLMAEVISALTDVQMQRTLHDRIAGTRVIYLGA